MFLLEPALDPAIEQQAVARVHRIGQEKPVTITRLLIDGSVECRVLTIAEEKQRLLQEEKKTGRSGVHRALHGVEGGLGLGGELGVGEVVGKNGGEGEWILEALNDSEGGSGGESSGSGDEEEGVQGGWGMEGVDYGADGVGEGGEGTVLENGFGDVGQGRRYSRNGQVLHSQGLEDQQGLGVASGELGSPRGRSGREEAGEVTVANGLQGHGDFLEGAGSAVGSGSRGGSCLGRLGSASDAVHKGVLPAVHHDGNGFGMGRRVQGMSATKGSRRKGEVTMGSVGAAESAGLLEAVLAQRKHAANQ